MRLFRARLQSTSRNARFFLAAKYRGVLHLRLVVYGVDRAPTKGFSPIRITPVPECIEPEGLAHVSIT